MAMALFLETSLWGSVWGERQSACMRVGMWLDKRSFLFYFGQRWRLFLDLILLTAIMFLRSWPLALFCVSSRVGTRYSKATHPLLALLSDHAVS